MLDVTKAIEVAVAVMNGERVDHTLRTEAISTLKMMLPNNITLEPRYPHVRTLTWCPACGNDKHTGSLLCVPCTYSTDGSTVNAMLAKIERREYTPRSGRNAATVLPRR